MPDAEPSDVASAERALNARDVPRSARFVGALQRVSAALASTLERERVLETIVRTSLDALGAAAGAIAELSDDGTTLHVVSAVGYPSALIERVATLPVKRFDAIARLVQDRRPVLIPSQEAFEQLTPDFARLTPVSGARAAIPLATPERVVGILILTFADAKTFDAEERDLLRLLGQQCAMTLERARLFGEERVARREAEWASARLSEALERMHDLHFVCDREWRYTRMNRAMREFLRESGFEADQLMGRVVWEVFPRLVGGEMWQAMQRAAEEQISVPFTARGTYADSWYDGSAYPLLDAIAVHAHNTTEQRRAQREVARLTTALKQRVEEMETLLRVIPVGIGIATDAECAEILANPALAQMLGISETMNASKSSKDGASLPFRLLRGGVEVPADQLPLQLAGRTGETVPFTDFELVRDSGERMNVIETAAPIFDGSGKVRGSVAAFIDITERKRVEQDASILSEASAMFAASPDVASTFKALAETLVPRLADVCVIFVVRESGSVGVAAMTATDNAILQQLRDFDHDNPVDGTPTHPVWRAIRGGETVLVTQLTDESIAHALSSDQGVLNVAKATGTTSLLLVPIRARGQVLGAVGLGTRRSRRHFDERDQHLIEEIGKRAGLALDNARLLDAELRARREAEAAHAEAERASKGKSDFLAMMSHELRTPLNAIAGYAELIEMGLRGPVTESQASDLAKIRQNQRHLLGLINQVLSFARIDAGRMIYDVEHVPVDAALRSAEPLIEPQLRARNLSYSVSTCESTVTVKCDGEKLQQVLLNLLGNATKFTPKGGKVSLSCSVEPQTITIRVSDNGVGIPSSQLQSIFEPFVQGDRPIGTSNEGVGLGLAISREFARGMGGELSVVSEVGVGSTFSLTLPRGPDRAVNA